MKKNVGGLDRWARIILGVILILLVFVGPQTKWGWIGLIPLLTGLFNFCPLYLPFKFSTNKESNE